MAIRCEWLGRPNITRSSALRSVRFLVPGLLYAVNSNIYLLGLTYVPPTIWLILTSARTVFTALTYKVEEDSPRLYGENIHS